MSLTRFFYDPRFPFEEFDRLFDDTCACGAQNGEHKHRSPPSSVVKPFRPRLDLHEDAEANKVTAKFDLPGLKKEDVKIDVTNGQLVVSGESNTSSEKTEGEYTVRERRSGKFSRVLPLPKGTKPEDISAKMEEGVLSVTFPKTNPDQAPARITIG